MATSPHPKQRLDGGLRERAPAGAKARVPPIALAVAALVVPVGLSGCRVAGGTAPPGTVEVVAGENFWGDIAAQVGGDHVEVRSILTDPAADPHLYESSAADAVAVASAAVVVENGAGYDDWLSRLVGATRHPGRTVVDVATVLGESGTDVNPHFWYDTAAAAKVAAAVEAALARAEPAYGAAFASNLAVFDASLVPVEQVVSQIRRRYAGSPVAYTERLPAYLLESAGLRVETPAGFASALEEGDAPSPADTSAMDRLLTRHRVDVLLYNEQAGSAVTRHVEALARSSGIPVVAVTETMPRSAASYQAWQLAQARALLAALGGPG